MIMHNVNDPAFRPYGKVITDIDCSELMAAMQSTPAGDDVVYVASAPELESLAIFKVFQDRLYGGMPTQMGYCNGTNHKLNALEYHRDSEFNFAASDLVLLLGLEKDVEDDFTYDTAKVEAFFVPAGTLLECYATSLHYAPCSAGGVFRCVVSLPKGTNEALPRPMGTQGEDKLLTHVNKWLIAHPESGLGDTGAYLGLMGENLTLN